MMMYCVAVSLCRCVADKKVRAEQSKTIKVKNRAQPLVSVNSIAIACSAYVHVYCVWSKIIVVRSFYKLYTPCLYNIAALVGM